MEYHEAADFCFGLRRFRPKPGTESTARLLAHLENPHNGVDFVQVAGSNGKGSTARMLERTLREAGLSVGLYTSPHLEDLRERVRIDGRKIPRSAVTEYVEAVRGYVTERAADGESPTFFETMTGMALWHFGREDVDVAILEVGIGGRLDATSVVDPIASAVTSVTLEHTGIIGETETEIAADKAHVAPADTPLVTGVSGEPLEAVRSVADEVVTVGHEDGNSHPDVAVSYDGRQNHTEAAISIDADDWDLETRIPLLGTHQAENAGIAAVLSRQITDVSEADLARGLRSAHWPGRFEVMETEPLVVLDGAHNPGACETVAETLASYEYDDLHLVVGAMHDKDHREMAAAMPTATTVVTAEPSLDRAEDRNVLARVFEEAGTNEVRTAPSVQDALTVAIERAETDDCVLVAGSLFAVAEARSRWTAAGIPKRIRNLEDARETLEGADVRDPELERAEENAVHRVLKTNLAYRQARELKDDVLRLGGDCVLSGHGTDGERVDAVLMGTLETFEELIDVLETEGGGSNDVARELRTALELEGTETSTGGDDTRWPWEDSTAVMGILNVTPDSFHDGGEYDALEDAVSRAEAMVAAGVDVLDVGGESTRPGAEPVSVEKEIDRVVPVIEHIADLDASVSIDTRKAAVADAALEAGADIVNDVSGLEDPDMRFVVAEHDAGLVVMHSIDAPVVPDRAVTYDDVVEDVIDQLSERILLAEKAGLDREQIVVDPGLGFGKSSSESFELLGRADEFRALGCPVLIGHSHKSMFGHVDRASGERLAATVAATAIATDRGADVIRVHDAPENVAAVRTALAARDPAQFEW
ncbi:dihydropteroate synthase [Natronobacterium gregoryi]|uniref:Probable bifunctional folylpolyglutamate synthase/dihydropteroate synthase n=2 Tax=Natronobacterium gregoryi TaxID=44930 RepID=L0ANE9_NATGS|nr:dihydropteroate synthase [Natronobacterium gregoryi]AFZ74722.1 dihydropteroate synthase [Natronobacterium gregoryi SP2]ELY73471.1 dihydropteroate synthase [Natronobacterium gregoryi SP2]PLK20966.1 dihydropteroate synthase [Natronobacterium gregoryi SP2]SFJ04068.1 dihydropteroate synthase [Natronobacterium gregoryi]